MTTRLKSIHPYSTSSSFFSFIIVCFQMLTNPITKSWVSRSGWWKSSERSEAPRPCCQWASVPCTTSGLCCASCAHGGQLSDPSGSRAAGVPHGPATAETEPRHANPEAPGFGPSGDPTRERVQVCIFITHVTPVSSYRNTYCTYNSWKSPTSLGCLKLHWIFKPVIQFFRFETHHLT